jgi:hypothetical protein
MLAGGICIFNIGIQAAPALHPVSQRWVKIGSDFRSYDENA